MFIDVHTHINNDYDAIKSVHAHDFMADKIPQNQFFTSGIHPWFADSKVSDSFVAKAKDYLSKNFIAIGECGLDRAKGPDLDIQMEVFEQQLMLANELQLPVIIHQVKSISDIIPFLKKYNSLSYILHAYYGNEIQTRQLLNLNVWFSFGESLLQVNSKLKKSLSIIPVDRLFLETDDTEISIESLYKEMAVVKNVNMDVLQFQVNRNFEAVFKRKFDELD